MTFLRAAPAALSIALLMTAVSPAAESDKKTVVTISGPVAIPGVHISGMGVLPAGTYVFKLLNSNSDRHIVQIFNQDETKIYATILAIPNYRLQVTDKTSITFYEGVGGKPEALRAWFYPGANWGEEFVYPKAKAAELAKITNLPVLAVTTEYKEEVAAPEAPTVVAQLQAAPVVAVRPTGDVVEIAQVVQTTPTPTRVAAAQVPEPVQLAQNQLPATGSPLPLVELGGLLALGGAFAIRYIRNRAA